MAKYYGQIGFVKTEEKSPGVYAPVHVTRTYSGDVLQNYRKWEETDGVNDNLNISNRISVVTDSFLLENLQVMRYVEWMGCKWKIKSIDVVLPRVNLTIGDVYNGQEDETNSSVCFGEDLGE